MASPTKGQFLEAEVFDLKGEDQGTVFIEVVRIYAPGGTGRTILGNYITATDAYYRYWVTTAEGSPSTVDGNYHLCKSDARICMGGPPGEIIVHLGKWRSWKAEELEGGEIGGLAKEARGEMIRYFKGGRRRADDSSKGALPWEDGGEGEEGARDSKGSRAAKAAKPDDPKKGPDRKAAKSPAKKDKEDERRSKISALEKELRLLKDAVALEEKEKAKAAEGDKKKKDETRTRPKKKKRRKDESEKEGKKSEREKTSDETSEGSGPEESGSGEGEKKDEKKHPKKKGKTEKAKKGSEGKKDKKSTRRKKKRKKKKSSEENKKKKGKDRGPFGLAETEKWSTSGNSSDDNGSDESSENSSFQKASPSLSHHLKLVRYAQRHPGRLAARLMRKMQTVVGFGGGAVNKSLENGEKYPTVAHMYYVAMMSPSLRDRWTQRTQRELKVNASLLDLLADDQRLQALDVLAQRMKALERSVYDGNTWRKAKFLELVPEDEVSLVDRGEENMMAKEMEHEEKMRGKGQWSEGQGWNRKGKGGAEKGTKGEAKGDRKGKKKGKTPAEQATGKREEGGA